MESTFNARYVIAFRLESVTFDDQMDYKSAAPQDYRNGADMCLFHFYSSLLLLALVLVLFVLLSLIKQSNRFSRNHFRTAHIFGVLTETTNVSEVNGQMSSSVEIKIMHTFMILCYLVYKSHALSVRVRRRFLSTSVFFK